MVPKRPRIPRGNRGTMYVDLIVKVLVIVIVVLTVISLLGIFAQYQQTAYIAKRVTRAIELAGAADDSIFTLFDDLCAQTGLSNPTLTITDVGYFDPVQRTIQLRDTFTVTVTSTYAFHVFTPIIGERPPPMVIPLTASLTGMSEVYHKPEVVSP